MKASLYLTSMQKIDTLTKLLPKEFAARLTKELAAEIFSTKKGGLLLHITENKELIAVQHLGDTTQKSSEEIQHEAANAVVAIKNKLSTITSVTLTLHILPELQAHTLPIEKGVLLASLAVEDGFKSKKTNHTLVVHGITQKDLHIITTAIHRARQLTSTPANLLTTEHLVNEIKQLTKISKDIKVKILRRKELEKENMGCFLGVASGTRHEPALAIIEYTPAGTGKDAPIALVGKGLIFDTGGYSIKPSDSMADMYGDMGGAATVIGIITALAQLKTKKRIVGICGICENLINEHAYKPGDILTSRKGLTVEVENTDAEGRLVLADCLNYAEDTFKPSLILDFATLTGACAYSLGELYTGIFTDNHELITTFTSIGQQTNDWVWPLPFDHIIKKGVDSPRADLTNTSTIKGALGASTAAAFLSKFVKDTKKWIHFDIAGTALRRKQRRAYDYKGYYGSGGMVHTAIAFIRGK